jgi:hypothetical protein
MWNFDINIARAVHVNHRGEHKHWSSNYLFVVGSRVTTGN